MLLVVVTGRRFHVKGELIMDWRGQAACRNYDPETWFPVGSSGPALRQVEAAKTVCRTCPVITECRDHALSRNEVGVWGGMSEPERKELRRETAPPPRVVPEPPAAAVTRLCTGCDLTRHRSEFSPSHTRCRACRRATRRARRRALVSLEVSA